MESPEPINALERDDRIPLGQAVLCMDCDSIIHASRGRCHCGSRSVFPVARAIRPLDGLDVRGDKEVEIGPT